MLLRPLLLQHTSLKSYKLLEGGAQVRFCSTSTDPRRRSTCQRHPTHLDLPLNFYEVIEMKPTPNSTPNLRMSIVLPIAPRAFRTKMWPNSLRKGFLGFLP